MILPSIPDSVAKFFTYSGIILIGFGYYESMNARKAYTSHEDRLNAAIDSLKIQQIIREQRKDELKKLSSDLAKINDVKDPITDHDSIVYFQKTLSGASKEKLVTDSIAPKWQDFKKVGFEIKLLSTRLDILKEVLEIEDDRDTQSQWFFGCIAFLGLMMTAIGIAGMQTRQSLEEKHMLIDIRDKGGQFNHCQSCGRKFNSMVKPDKNVPETVNLAFCSDCFKSGSFVELDITQEEYLARWINDNPSTSNSKIKELRKHLSKLERWNANRFD
ncbi:zinc ribbon domain-containing protein [Terrimonas alba]|uniref:zinc ribbon domain-containing protein n=1 Tax=Terrimonas alba TaxID=3349636 RepID=UPI0035F411DB